MSMSKRLELRQRYIDGWYQMDVDLLLGATAADFIFDDPAEPEPVTRAMLAGYMQRWNRRANRLGGNNQWILTHELRADKDGILTDWEWWEVVDSGLRGAALVLTGDRGVFAERITYFDRNLKYPATELL
jgi:hypothetical protein